MLNGLGFSSTASLFSVTCHRASFPSFPWCYVSRLEAVWRVPAQPRVPGNLSPAPAIPFRFMSIRPRCYYRAPGYSINRAAILFRDHLLQQPLINPAVPNNPVSSGACQRAAQRSVYHREAQCRLAAMSLHITVNPKTELTCFPSSLTPTEMCNADPLCLTV